MPARLIDLTERVFRHLTVIERAPHTGGQAHWLCRCSCGAHVVAAGSALRTGRINSCGCQRSATARRRVAEHGVPDNTRHDHGNSRKAARTPTYISWMNMIQRTSNRKNPAWKDYGGRGITVCERWRDFANFLADMGERPAGLTLDRIDNDRGYEPGNCRWATWTEQRLNQRNRKAETR